MAVEKSGYKEKYGFENNSDKVAGILWKRLTEFVPREEMKQFCGHLFELTKLEFNLQDKNSPTKEQVQNRAKEYFTKIVPQIYDLVMTNFQNVPKQYHPYKDYGPLETFEKGRFGFLSLEGIAEHLEGIIRKKYKNE